MLLQMQIAKAQSEDINIATFCKVWGFLKYYHPAVANGKIDWDKEFVNRIEHASKLNSQDKRSKYYLKWIEDLGVINECKNCSGGNMDDKVAIFDAVWKHELDLLTPNLVEKLKFIFRNRYQGENYYVSYKRILFTDAASPNYSNENKYADSVYPSYKMRLLTLSRYWNIINYFYPYKQLIVPGWDSVLIEKIPRFKNTSDTVDYHLAIAELNASIQDSHSPFFWTSYTVKYFGVKAPIFQYSILNDTAIVTGFYNDSLGKKSDIEIGDIILKAGERSIKSIIDEKSRFVGASNYKCLLRDIRSILLIGSEDSILLTIRRKNSIVKQVIYRYPLENLLIRNKEQHFISAWKSMNDSVGYVDLARLKPNEVSRMMNEFRTTKAIIFDIRNYPQNVYSQISNHLNNERKAFVSFEVADKSFPGTYVRNKTLYTGRKNENYYKGLVVLLMDEKTQSMAELTVMALLTAPNVISIGNHTAGTNGDARSIPLPGGQEIKMSSVGVYFPDGRQTQRIGIKPDIIVTPTAEGIKNQRDEVLEKALELVNFGKREN